MLVNFIFQGVQNLFATTYFPSLSVEYHFHSLSAEYHFHSLSVEYHFHSLSVEYHFHSLSVEYHFHATVATLMCSKSCRLNLPMFCLVCGHFWNALVIVIPFLFHQWNNPICICCRYQKHTGKIIVAY